MRIENCTAYELMKKEKIDELDSMGYILSHKKTKARIVVLENDDRNKVFNIGFRTPPKDSTGVAHIVEHTVLCGSDQFPVKDPFIELTKGSLNTFLNAMTYPDKTVYPIASCNDKDFQNLMHVYLDAVFHPNIYKEEKIFKQEGWHYELESVEEPLKYNGVVFNEMKGVFSSPDELIERDIKISLFPDTAYGVESGGDPEDIPNLTYQAYLDFHSKYYHPSNSYIYLYGDMDMEEKLNWIDEHYLCNYDYLEVDSNIELQKPFEQRRDQSGFYSVTEDEEGEDNACLSYNAVCGDSLDPQLYLAFQVLNYVLVRSVGAPLKQALLEAGIGSEISGCYEESIKQPMFMIIAKKARMEQKQQFLDIIRDVLIQQVSEGINEKSLRAGISALEFQFREGDFGPYPKGLMYGLQILDSWLYDDEKPFVHVKANDTFKCLKDKIGTRYYEELIQKYLIDNTHTSFVSIEPKVGLTAILDQQESKRLADYKQTLSQADLERLVQETCELRTYQEEPTPQEALSCIPIIKREDIGKKAIPFKTKEARIGKIPVWWHDVFTNGINYLRFSFDIKDFLKYAPYISLLTDVVGYVDTTKYSKLELSNELLLHAGNFSITTTIYNSRKRAGEYEIRLEVGTKVLLDETTYVAELIGHILSESKLDDVKRLKEIIGEARSARQEALQSAGHNTAAGRANAYLSESGYYADQMQGVGYYDFLCDLDDHFEERKEHLVEILEKLYENIFAKERLLVDVTTSEDGYSDLEQSLDGFLKVLPESREVPSLSCTWQMEKPEKNEGFKSASKIQYVARVGNYFRKGIPYSGVNRVVKTILNYDFLWNQVRVKGGAYGVMCNFGNDGRSYMVSYRDPKLAETNDTFCEVPEYLRNFDASDRDMLKYIIGTISELDTPLTPRAEGVRSYQAMLIEITDEDVQRERDQILAADVNKIREVAPTVEAVLSDECICVLGSEEKVKENEALFNVIKTLK